MKLTEKQRKAAKKWRESNPEKHNNWKYRNPLGQILARLKTRAKTKRVEFSLVEEDLVVPEKCPVFGTPLVLHTTRKIKKDLKKSVSVDRKDSSKGYTKDNIQIMSAFANRMKNNANSDELLRFADWIYKTYKTRS